MASTQYVLKCLSQYGPVGSDGRRRYWLKHAGHSVSFIDQQGKAICIRVRSLNDHDDPSADYSAGVYLANISQAISIAGW